MQLKRQFICKDDENEEIKQAAMELIRLDEHFTKRYEFLQRQLEILRKETQDVINSRWHDIYKILDKYSLLPKGFNHDNDAMMLASEDNYFYWIKDGKKRPTIDFNKIFGGSNE